MKLGVEVKNGQQSSNPELFFYLTPLTPPTTLPHTPLTQNTNFANFGPIWMKIGVVVVVVAPVAQRRVERKFD